MSFVPNYLTKPTLQRKCWYCSFNTSQNWFKPVTVWTPTAGQILKLLPSIATCLPIGRDTYTDGSGVLIGPFSIKRHRLTYGMTQGCQFYDIIDNWRHLAVDNWYRLAGGLQRSWSPMQWPHGERPGSVVAMSQISFPCSAALKYTPRSYPSTIHSAASKVV